MCTAGIPAGLCLAMMGPCCFAQTPVAAVTRIETRIPPETLGAALKQFAQSRHMEVLYITAEVKGLRTKGASGKLTANETLLRLLSGTGMEYRYVGTNAVSILSGQSMEKKTPAPPGKHLSSNTTLHGDTTQASKVTGNADPQPDPPTPKKHGHTRALQEVVITGSRLRTTSKYGPQEVYTYDQAQIEQSGQNSIADFLSTLPSVPLKSGATAFGLGSTVTLRGLPAGSTLILLNGRPLESGGMAYWEQGGAFFDLNDIPLAAVKTIEVDENGSSAVYGSDGIAGVVNIITKSHFNGFAVDARYGWAKDTTSARAALAWGRQWDRGGLSVIASYEADGGLVGADRFLTASTDFSSFGGPDLNVPDCSPGNVFSISGAPLPGAPIGSTATYAAVTGGAETGKPPLSQFTFGSLNTCSITAPFTILPATHRAAVLMQGNAEITQDIELFTEVMYTHLTQVQRGGYQLLYGSLGYQQFSVSPSNPYNPFGTTVGVAESLSDVPIVQNFTTDFFRPLVGLRGTLPDNWQWELSTWQSVDWTQYATPFLVPNDSAIQDALNSSDPAVALNPFVNGPVAPRSELLSFFSDGNAKWMGRDRSIEAFARGPALQIPAGSIQAVIGGDYTRSTFYANEINDGVDPLNTRWSFERVHYAVFGEARIPLIRGPAPAREGSLLAFTVAGRHDQYGGVGGATTKQFGLEFRPAEGVLIRGTYADAFQAPSLTDLYLPQTSFTNQLQDPVTGQSVFAQVVNGGNANLKPMTGRSHTVGIVYASPTISGLTLAATQWQVIERNVIQPLSAQLIVNNESLFPGDVVRGAAGVIQEVFAAQVNFGTIDVAGVDYQLGYRRQVGPGAASITVTATDTYHYTEALVPGGEPVDADSIAQDTFDWAPRWKGLVELAWKEGPVEAHLLDRYTGIYQDYDSARRIGNFWLLDANLRWNVGRAFGLESPSLRDSYLEVGGTNLLNRAPQYSNFDFGYYGIDLSQMSAVGRSLYVQAGLQW